MMLDEFRAHLRAHKSLTAQQKYTQAAKGFLGYLAMTGRTLQTMHPGALRGFVTFLVTPEPGIQVPSAATVHLQLAGVRSYLDFLRGEGVKLLPAGEMVKPEKPKLDSRMPIVLTLAEVRAYAGLCLAEAEPYGTAMLIAPFSGLRVDELCHLRLGDVAHHDYSPEDRRYVLTVRQGKGSRPTAPKRRLAPLLTGPNMAVSRALHQYLTETRPKFPRDESAIPRAERWLFPAVGSKFYRPIGAARLQETCVRWRSILGVPDMHPHMARATYATALLSLGVDALTVSRYLGHSKGIEVLVQHYAGCLYQRAAAEALFGFLHSPDQAEWNPRRGRLQPQPQQGG